MKAAEARWSRHVWFWGFIFLFLSHAFAVFWLAERETLTRSWQKPAPFLHLAGDSTAAERLARYVALRDPTLFALPHVRGFSGGAWLRFQREAPKLTNWTAPPEWLVLSPESLGRSLDYYLATNRPSAEELLAAVRSMEAPEVRIPDLPLLSNSTVRFHGALEQRKLAFAPTLPSLPTNDVVARTVIGVAVNADGVVESAAVVRESGSPWADEQGLELARAFLFAPARTGRAGALAPPTFGQIIFTWNTVPQNATHAAAPASTQ
jgi:hypothetical protein